MAQSMVPGWNIQEELDCSVSAIQWRADTKQHMVGWMATARQPSSNCPSDLIGLRGGLLLYRRHGGPDPLVIRCESLKGQQVRGLHSHAFLPSEG